ncbi:MAG TPA: hypothetical protein VD789_12870, partial [Thermomicrobiales bacterium]|nr:hypothetical protein [Thermomicrobiales bacterium]
HELLRETPGVNFYGNVEGKDIALGTTDVVVTDGFTGNVALKVAEGTAGLLIDLLREELTSSAVRKMASLVLRPAFRSLARRMDYAEVGGAPLLGVDGVAIVSHGRSNERAIENAIGVAMRSTEQNLAARIAERAANIPESVASASA